MTVHQLALGLKVLMEHSRLLVKLPRLLTRPPVRLARMRSARAIARIAAPIRLRRNRDAKISDIPYITYGTPNVAKSRARESGVSATQVAAATRISPPGKSQKSTPEMKRRTSAAPSPQA